MPSPEFTPTPNQEGSEVNPEQPSAKYQKTEHLESDKLSVEDKELMEKLESDTDRVYSLRVQLYRSYDRFKDYLPQGLVKKPGGRQGKIHFEELSQLTEEERRKVLDFSQLDKAVKAGRLELKKVQGKKIEALNALRDSLAIYEDLQGLGGGKLYSETKPATEQEEATSQYYSFRLKELAVARRKLAILDVDIRLNRDMYNDAISNELLDDPGEFRAYLNDEYQLLEDQYKELVESSPEAFQAVAYAQLKEAKDVFDKNGTIVETPYVKSKINRIMDTVHSRPVFIHGELGSGKTELAKHIARTRLSEPHLKRWEEDHQKPDKSDFKDEQSYQKALSQWQAERDQEAEMLEVHGSKETEKEDLTVRTRMIREETPSPEAQVEIFNRAWDNFQTTVIARQAEEIKDPKEKEHFLSQAQDQLREAYREKFRSHVETLEILSPIYQGMGAGRPVLVDEMNAIPHHVLIILNDIINKKPGDKVLTPSGRMINVEEGFSIICTGNWKPEDGKMYVGRQQIDAAFLSRFTVEDYDYLPQNLDFSTLEEGGDIEGTRKARQENELFRMMVVRLLDKHLGAKLPGGEEALHQLNNLAICARMIQDVFSQKKDISHIYEEEGVKKDPQLILKENVLSIRTLIPIIERWKNDGFTRKLDDYIFLEYINRSKARPDEMQYIYYVLQNQGNFFNTSEGWPDSKTADGRAELQKFNIVEKMYGVDKLTGHQKPIPATIPNPNDPDNPLPAVKPKEYCDPQIILKKLFGQPPARKRVSKEPLRPSPIEDEEKAEEEKRSYERFKRTNDDGKKEAIKLIKDKAHPDTHGVEELLRNLYGITAEELAS